MKDAEHSFGGILKKLLHECLQIATSDKNALYKMKRPRVGPRGGGVRTPRENSGKHGENI